MVAKNMKNLPSHIAVLWRPLTSVASRVKERTVKRTKVSERRELKFIAVLNFSFLGKKICIIKR